MPGMAGTYALKGQASGTAPPPCWSFGAIYLRKVQNFGQGQGFRLGVGTGAATGGLGVRIGLVWIELGCDGLRSELRQGDLGFCFLGSGVWQGIPDKRPRSSPWYTVVQEHAPV